MNFQNLREHQHELVSYMQKHGYSKRHIKNFQSEISRILENATAKGWSSYREVYLDYVNRSYSKSHLRTKRTVIGALERFDLHGKYPDGRSRHELFERGSYHLLSQEFKDLVDHYCSIESLRGKKDTTIHSEAHHAATFLLSLQTKGAISLDEVTEESVLSFFVTRDGTAVKSYSYKRNITNFFKVGVTWNASECNRILSYLPQYRSRRKNIQYLTEDEIRKVRSALADQTNGLSMRDRAIVMVLMYTGLRSSDVVSLKLDDINWELRNIQVEQQKTLIPLTLPLSILVGNAIYDYLQFERANVGNTCLFLSATHPFSPLSRQSIWDVSERVMIAAGIRQTPGMRKGTHIFRHCLASSLLGNGVPQPVISQVLGHTSPKSVEHYLSADFIHLKECSLDISCFPVAEGVFENV